MDAPERSPTRYAACPGDALLVRPLDAVTLLYHRPSGQTHLVVSPVPEILAALRAGEAHVGEVVARLSADFDLGPAEAAQAAVAVHLEELVAIGLARRV
jgi:PqqD family protein of HPr-rel-A system